MTSNKKHLVLLCILDGWGIGKNNSNNAISVADTPVYDRLITNYPISKIEASGKFVGLPSNQIGNSEVGHMSIGSGRIIEQTLPKINKSIYNDDLKNENYIDEMIESCIKNNKSCHLLGLLSPGGVHSHENHIIFLAKKIVERGVKVKIHAILDGRDVDPHSSIDSIHNFLEKVKTYNNIQICSISGRYYAMDRDNNWDRTKLAYDVIVNGAGKSLFDPITTIKNSYKENITDEFIIPSSFLDYNGVVNGDALIIANFRADRIRQISSALVQNEFNYFDRKKVSFSCKISMTEYSDVLNPYFNSLFPSVAISKSLGEILEHNKLKQLRIAETEKYAHVTFFFSGGREKEFFE